MDETLKLADAQIEGVSVERGVTAVRLKDWREASLCMYLEDAIGMECFDCVGRDLSHATWLADHPLIGRSLTPSEESEENVGMFHCMTFFSASSGEAILSIVARVYRVDPP